MKELRLPLSLLRSLMKFTVYQLLLAAIIAGLATARPVEAQRVMDQRVTLRADNLSLKTVLNQLGHQADVRFAYRSALIQLNDRVTLSATNQPLGDVLNPIFLAGTCTRVERSLP